MGFEVLGAGVEIGGFLLFDLCQYWMLGLSSGGCLLMVPQRCWVLDLRLEAAC